MASRRQKRRSNGLISTIGHGTRSIGEFVAILDAHAITHVIDIRKMPRSLANPQFNLESISNSLGASAISYTHMPGLTGLRKAAKVSINEAWRNKSFRAFADYMQTPDFAASLDTLVAMAKVEKVALMCAETLPWRCHRSLVADALAARGIAVQHIMSESNARAHVVPSFARFDGTHVFYPAGTDGAPL